jgi:TPR repeat protein
MAGLVLAAAGLAAQEPSVAQLERGCQQGKAADCGSLGFRLLFGDGVSPDASRAAGLFKKACDAGDANACHDLGTSLPRGLRARLRAGMRGAQEAHHALTSR